MTSILIRLARASLLWLMFGLTACAGLRPITAAPGASTQTLPTRPVTPTTTAGASSHLSSLNRAWVAGQWHTAFYDAGLHKVLLINGGSQNTPANRPLEIWEWDGAHWLLLSADTTGPTWRNFVAVAYDPARNVVVLHGGLQQRGQRFDETWEWNGQTWTQLKVPGPGAREGALMVYDSDRQRMVLFGGAVNNDVLGDTWEWDGQTWVQVSTTGPAPRFAGGMVYDAAREVTLLYSGHFNEAFADLWVWNGISWTEIPITSPAPGVRIGTAMVFDDYTEQVLLVGGGEGTFISDVWAWDGNQWVELPITQTPARSGHNLVFNPAQNQYLFIGGVDRPGGRALSDTWALVDYQWLCVEGCTK